ncbi:hypothetical protein [Acidiphilium sp. JA12-A1]|uniref:hypothetical protein n=1 Tax=Acidiphilium sp. JA12-A1 TaxID=1464546 RepID=UPI00128EA2F4|nr:hypothetical protein [Acidiphilium sp. JA12-A1]
MWLEGRSGNIIGGLSIVFLIYLEFSAAVSANLLNPSDVAVFRWKLLIMAVGFGVGLSIGLLKAVSITFGGAFYAAIAAVLAFIGMTAIHWANTGNFYLYRQLYWTTIVFSIPVASLLWFWREFKKDMKKSGAIAVVIKSNPFMIILQASLSFISAILVLWIKSKLPIIEFIQKIFGN